MAAVSLHHAVLRAQHPPDALGPLAPPLAPSSSGEGRAPHLRALSSQSEATLASLNRLSFPTAESSGHAGLLTQHGPMDQPRYGPGTPGQRPSGDVSFGASPAPLRTPGERQATWDSRTRRRQRRLGVAKHVLEGVIAVWAGYTLVRYFLGYTLYTSHDRRIITLVLGACSTLSLLLILPSLLSAIPRLRDRWKRRHTLRLLLSLSPYLASLFLFIPAVVSFILVFVWRRSSDAQKAIQGRCTWDIDVVWSGTGRQCVRPEAPPWGAWIAASVVRLVLTIIILLSYHLVSHLHPPSPAPNHSLLRPLSLTPTSPTRPTPQETTSSNKLRKQPSARRVPPPSMRALPSATSAGRPYSTGSDDSGWASVSGRGGGAPGSPGSPAALLPNSEWDEHRPRGGGGAYDPYAGYPASPSPPPPAHTQGASADDADAQEHEQEQEQERERERRRTADLELIRFAAQFRGIVSQMQADARAGALDSPASSPASSPAAARGGVLAQEDGTTPGSSSSDDDDYGFPVAPGAGARRPGSSTGEGGGGGGSGDVTERDRLRVVLGRIVRRLPTIESLGSREATSPAASLHRTRAAPQGGSRPPTRATMRTVGTGGTGATGTGTAASERGSSAGPSRSNSLTLRAAVGEPRPSGTSIGGNGGGGGNGGNGRASPADTSSLYWSASEREGRAHTPSSRSALEAYYQSGPSDVEESPVAGSPVSRGWDGEGLPER